ncbi:MAG: hypothetical protein L3J79_12980, partial [Candidatus Marinimicrobia bacterium]|nr:hypothetical protein [Candidatus Neomarinimicrobiota bacterium]
MSIDIHGEARDALPDLGADEWLNVDRDSDGLVDGDEMTRYLTDVDDADSDDDGLSDGDEVLYATDPWVVDSDGDGEADGYEVSGGSDPLDVLSFVTDVDTDGLPDAWELLKFGDIISFSGEDDPDGEGLNNIGELLYGTEPNTADTDADGPSDKWEIDHDYDALNSSDGLLDTDGDDLPDWVEVYTEGLNPDDATDAYSDFDGDRVPNIYEYKLGFDLTDKQNFPAPTAIVDQVSGGDSAIDNVYTTISEALSAISARTWPTIEVRQGTYAEKVVVSKRVSLYGQIGVPLPRIAGPGDDHPVYITSGGSGSVINGFVIQQEENAPSPRSGIRGNMANGEVRIANCLIRGNSGQYGGGIRLYRGMTIVEHCTFIENSASLQGDAIYIYNNGGGQLILRNSILWNPNGSAAQELGGQLYTVAVQDSIVRTGQLGGSADDPLLTAGGFVTINSPARDFSTKIYQKLDAQGDLRGIKVDAGFDEFIEIDTDGDGLVDSEELYVYLTDPDNPDSDADGLSDGDEIQAQTNPNAPDTDGDGLPDGWEVVYGLDPITIGTDATDDVDNDGLSNLEEFTEGTDPNNPDSDGDGLSDGDEVDIHGADPNLLDTDADGLPDGWELANGLDPLVAGADATDDPDEDGLDNLGEYTAGSDPNLADS